MSTLSEMLRDTTSLEASESEWLHLLAGDWQLCADLSFADLLLYVPLDQFSLAVADGPTMDDVVFGYVYDFGSGEEWRAERAGGEFLAGAPSGGRRLQLRRLIVSFGTDTCTARARCSR